MKIGFGRKLFPIHRIENWIWKIFCPGKEDCEKLNNLHPKNYPPLCMRFFAHRSAARTTPPRLCNLHKRLDPLLLVNVQFAQTCEKRKKPLAIPIVVCYHLTVDRENRTGQRAARVHAWEVSRAGKSQGSLCAVYLDK